MPDEAHEMPWTEEQWEAFMKRADVRSARYGELLETLHNDPECDIRIDREMGWKRTNPDEASRDEWFAGNNIKGDDNDSAEADEEMRESDRALEKIEAYRFAMRAERQLHRILDPYMDRKNPEPDERFGQVWISPCIAAAKISGGHAMGYEDDVLCGNIVNIRRGLAAVEEGLESVQTLQTDGLIQADEAKEIFSVLTTLQEKINARIAELRDRVWWDKRT